VEPLKKRHHTVFIGMVLLFMLPFRYGLKIHSSVQVRQESTMRALADTVGFCRTPKAIEAVIRAAEKLEKKSLKAEAKKFPDHWIAGISPHDDHLYAGRVYIHLFRNLKAKRIVLFGVAHKARQWKAENTLIFDDHAYWRGPYGPVQVSSIREEIMDSLPEEDYLISGRFHDEEHSLEGLIPFLQYYNRESTIVPILIPAMNWERMDILANHLAEALAKVIQENAWVLGEDIAFLISNDCVHYGDEDWGGKNYADFGVDRHGYEQAVLREERLIDTHLTGPVEPARLKALLYRLVEEKDVQTYRIPWCGRISGPFGLCCLSYLTGELERPVLEGHLLRYGTTFELGTLPVNEPGLGLTAPASLRHWVGFTSIGYR
jgi:AmmeMemoRadiSam system protein B